MRVESNVLNAWIYMYRVTMDTMHYTAPLLSKEQRKISDGLLLYSETVPHFACLVISIFHN